MFDVRIQNTHFGKKKNSGNLIFQVSACSVFVFQIIQLCFLEKMENNSAANYVFNPPDTLELECGDKNQPKHDKDSLYFKVNIRIFRSFH